MPVGRRFCAIAALAPKSSVTRCFAFLRALGRVPTGKQAAILGLATFDYARSIGVTSVVLTARYPACRHGTRFHHAKDGVTADAPAWAVTADHTPSIARARRLAP